MEGVERYGWLDKRDSKLILENTKQIARRLLLRGRPIETVAEDTELPLDTVIEIANQMQELPAGV